MLRRRLLVTLGSLVLLLAVAAVAAIGLLQKVLGDMERLRTTVWLVLEDVGDLNLAINQIEVHLYNLKVGRENHLDPLLEAVEQAGALVTRIGMSEMCRRPEVREHFQAMADYYPDFRHRVGVLGTVQDPQLAQAHTEAALDLAIRLQQDAMPLARQIRRSVDLRQQDLAARFRWLVLALALVFLIVINVAVIMLLRAAVMVLRPIDTLVEATRQLGVGRYDHRVRLDGQGEFAQLADAYNAMAEQLQAVEKRRMEVLQQVALALNHELNTAASIIDLQLHLLSRRSAGDENLEKTMRQIREGLARMTRFVQDLKHVRRIVLTDYIAGVKMLDVEKSLAEEQDERQADRPATPHE